MRGYLLALALCLLALPLTTPVRAQSTRISLSASSNRVAVGEPFAVEVRVEGTQPDELNLPDFDGLEVLGRSQGRSFNFSLGGGQRAELVYNFTVRAVKRGAITVDPAVAVVDGRKIASQKLTITVVDAAQGMQGMPGNPFGANAEPEPEEPEQHAPPGGLEGANYDPTMFLRTVVDKTTAYVGEQVTITLYLYVRGQLGDSPAISREPTLEGFWSQDLLALQRQLAPVRQDVRGRGYNAYVLRRFAAFPLRPGKLEVGAPAVEITTGGSIFDMGPPRTIRRNGVQVAIEALPLPPQPTRGAPTYTGTLTLEATLDAKDAKVGDAVTLRAVLKGMGNLRGLTLPSPQLKDVETLPPELDDEVSNELDQIGGQRVMRWLLLPRAPGEHIVPGFAVDVFDPATKAFHTVKTAPLRFTVSGQADPVKEPASTAAPDASAPRFGPVRVESALRRRTAPLRTQSWFWPTVLAAPLLLALLSGLRLAGRARARRRARGGEHEAMREVHARLDRAAKAAESGDARAALGLLASALKGALEARLDEPVGGLTMTALEAHLHQRGMDTKLTGSVIGQLGALESARFDPDAQGTDQIARSREGVKALITELARFRPKPRTVERTRQAAREDL
ncbi:MAG: BatD family protein [Polyangiales bacterium]